MNNHASIKTLILTAAFALGLSSAALAAEDAGPASAPVATSGRGLLGESYSALSYRYIDLHGTSADAHAYDLTLNQNVSEGFDVLLDYTYKNAEALAGGHANQRMFDLGVRAFTSTRGFKPYVEAGLGWEWAKVPHGYRANSPAYFLGTGVEFQVARDLALTPFVRYTDATKHGIGHEVDYGIKANYWLGEHAGIMASVSRDNSRDMQYGIGLTFRY